MSKKILLIVSSPRKGGNSDVLCDAFQQGASEQHQCEKIYLQDYQIQYCSGCGVCNQGMACPIQDDMNALFDKMMNSDVIVLSTPVYFYSLAAQMKTFIDRCCARYTELNNKEFYFITTAAEDNAACMERTVECFRGFLDCLEGAQERGVIYAHGVWQIGEVEKTAYLDSAYQMGKTC